MINVSGNVVAISVSGCSDAAVNLFIPIDSALKTLKIQNN